MAENTQNADRNEEFDNQLQDSQVDGGGQTDDADAVRSDPSLEAMKARVKEMEEEAAKLREMQAQVEKEMNLTGAEDKEAIDARSIYVGNVDYGATPEELQAHFASCGTINRVTILCDKWSGHPKGYAYVEFADPSLVANAMALNETLLRGRPIKVTAKRTNIPGFNRGSRGRGRGGYRGYGHGGTYYSRGRARGRRATFAPY